jgi:23S rRNA (cytidine2498-2'-O)-methyltransferase
MATGYLIDSKYKTQLQTELKLKKIKNFNWHQDLLILPEPVDLYWVKQKWNDVHVADFDSVSSAARKLKQSQVFWINSSDKFYRRSELILKNLKALKPKPFKFNQDSLPRAGAFLLTSPNQLVFSSDVDPAALNGEIKFAEDKSAPSRAYLKLWELFTRLNLFPQPNELCLDLGAAPGGWSWVLAGLDCQVIAVDRAPVKLPAQLQKKVKSLKQDAFGPEIINTKADWLFSDIICYPDKLYDFIQKVMAKGVIKNFVCTLKFQGQTDFDSIQKFANIQGSRIIHLSQNKHELTWIKTDDRSSFLKQ